MCQVKLTEVNARSINTVILQKASKKYSAVFPDLHVLDIVKSEDGKLYIDIYIYVYFYRQVTYIQKLMAWGGGQFSRYWTPLEEGVLVTTVIAASHLLSDGSQVNQGAQHL